MGTSRKIACIALALACLVAAAAFTLQATSDTSTVTAVQGSIQEISLPTAGASNFNMYNTNGTPPDIGGRKVTLCGSSDTNVYADVVSASSITADKTLTLKATVTTKMGSLSCTGEDQFAIFAADNITGYKGDEFGFVLPETGNAWYAYIQSPQIGGFFAWKPVQTVQSYSLEQHNFTAVYSTDGVLPHADFYVDGKLAWSTSYPDVSGKAFHMVLTSHKVSDQNSRPQRKPNDSGKRKFNQQPPKNYPKRVCGAAGFSCFARYGESWRQVV